MVHTARRYGNTEDLPSHWLTLKAMTRGTPWFSHQNCIGESQYAMVYQGEMLDGTPVAIKRFKHNSARSYTSIRAESEVQDCIRQDSHPNVRQLLGASYDPEEPLIVYEYLPGGDLKEHLEEARGNYLINDAFARLIVAIDVASALSTLHYNSAYPIYHRDVKSTNVLLDEDHRAKLADMGIAVVVKTDADLNPPLRLGSKGYICPVYRKTGRLDDKSDVYSFGVLLMELATCLTTTYESKQGFPLAKTVLDKLRKGVADELIEPGEVPGGRPLMKAMLLLACRCCSSNLSSRPTILEVMNELLEMYEETDGAPLAEQVRIPPDEYQNSLYGLENLSLKEVRLCCRRCGAYFYGPGGCS